MKKITNKEYEKMMITFLSHLEEGSNGIRNCMEKHLLA